MPLRDRHPVTRFGDLPAFERDHLSHCGPSRSTWALSRRRSPDFTAAAACSAAASPPAAATARPATTTPSQASTPDSAAIPGAARRPGQGARQQVGLEQDQHDARQAERDRDRQVSACRSGLTQQARINRPHGQLEIVGKLGKFGKSSTRMASMLAADLIWPIVRYG